MSSNEEKASEKAPDEPTSDSVFDFIYCDSRRIASFLAQFDDFGVLDKIVHREGVTKTSKRGWNLALGGGGTVLGTGGQGNASFGITPESGATEASERFYDPLWTNARTLLDYLQEHKLINYDINKTKLGQFVLVKGRVMLLDLGLMRGAWEKPTFQKLLKAHMEPNPQPIQNRRERRAQISRDTSKSSTEADAVLDLLAILPHTLQIILLSDDGPLWSTLDEEAVVGRSTDLILKHGVLIGGDWHMLGILDAYPYDANIFNDEIKPVLASLAETAIGQMIANLAPALQPMMGRPPRAWGITPLLVFRDVAKSNDQS